MFFILNSHVTSDIVATSMQRHADVNSNYFNSMNFNIINPDVHAFSQGNVMDIATKPVKRCNIVGSTLGITSTKLRPFSNSYVFQTKPQQTALNEHILHYHTCF